MFPTSTTNRLTMLLVVAFGVLGSGCNWIKGLTRKNPGAPLPVVLQDNSNQEAMLQAIVANSSRIQSLQTQSAKVQVPGAPAIGADFAFERPMKLRFRAGSILGQEVDLGSNPSEFWVWGKQLPGSTLFYAKHDQYAASPSRQPLPIEPKWLPQALGIVELSPGQQVDGPIPVDAQTVELRVRESGAIGDYVRVLRVHKQYGLITEQFILDSRNQLVVAARASDHQHYAAEGVSLPRKVELQMPQAQLKMTMTIPSYIINKPLDSTGMLFQIPKDELASYPMVDLANPQRTAVGIAPTGVPETALRGATYREEFPAEESVQAAPADTTPENYMPKYRGQPATTVPRY